jgi:hypothetical protein
MPHSKNFWFLLLKKYFHSPELSSNIPIPLPPLSSRHYIVSIVLIAVSRLLSVAYVRYLKYNVFQLIGPPVNWRNHLLGANPEEQKQILNITRICCSNMSGIEECKLWVLGKKLL